MSITSDLLRGHTDTIILSQLIKGDTYGYAINKVIKEKTNNMYELKEATLYSAFRRLEKLNHEGLIEIDANNIKLTSKGIDLANLVWEEFV